jgi:HlyD family type I secretion membrane fusion protein
MIAIDRMKTSLDREALRLRLRQLEEHLKPLAARAWNVTSARAGTLARFAREGTVALLKPRLKSNDLEMDLRPPIIGGLALIAAGFGGFLIWAAFAPLHSAVMAPGYVTVESQSKVIQHLEGGIVGDILVAEGSEVEAGDLLIRLDGRRAEAKKSQLEVRLFTLAAEKARLEAELAGTAHLAVAPFLEDQLENPRLASAMTLQKELMNDRRQGRVHREASLRTNLAQTQEEINGLVAQRQGREQRLTLLEERLGGMQQLAANGHVSRLQIAEVEGEVAALSGEIGDLSARIAGAHQKHDQAAEELSSFGHAWRTETADRLQSIERDFAETFEALGDAEDVLRRSDIRSPSAGTVQELKVHTPGAVIGAGMALMDIVPREDALVVEGHVRPEDVEGIYRGQAVHVRLSAFSFRRTQPVVGELTEISADRIIDPRTGLATYRIVATLDPESLAALTHVALKPGMPAEVMIVQTERTLLDYLIDPIIQVTERAFREK